MANAKRASMREGPLAALFRKTEGIEDEPPEARPALCTIPSRRPQRATAAST